MRKILSFICIYSAVSMFSCSALAADFLNASVYNPPAPSTIFIGGARVEEPTVSDSYAQMPMLFSLKLPHLTLEEYMRSEIINHSQSVDISMYNISSSYFSSMYNAFVFMNSDLPIYTGCTPEQDENGMIVSFKPKYIYSTKAESDEKTALLDALTTSIANYASAGITDEEKLLFAYDKIAENYYYTPGTEADFVHKNRTAFGLMDDGHGVCQGYAIMYSIVLNKLGIENYLCYNPSSSVNHIWNYVKLGENWYHSDPTAAETSDADVINHGFLLLSDHAILSYGNHGEKTDWEIQKPDASLPECKSAKYEDGYLFNVYNAAFYRDNKSLLFQISYPKDASVDMTVRSQSLDSIGLLLSEPFTYANTKNICFLTSRAYNSPFKVIGALYDASGRYKSCTRLAANSIGGSMYVSLPVPENSSGMTLKYFITAENYLTPLGLTSQMTIEN